MRHFHYCCFRAISQSEAAEKVIGLDVADFWMSADEVPKIFLTLVDAEAIQTRDVFETVYSSVIFDSQLYMCVSAIIHCSY